MFLNAPERQLLCTCAQARIPAGSLPHARELLRRGDVRWEEVGEAGWQHGVAALLHRNLQLLGWEEAVAPAQRRILSHYCQRTIHHTLRLLQALVDLLEEFSSAGVKVVVMKGPDLVYRVYGDPTLRGFRDLDLLVRPEDVARAQDVLVRAGFRLAPALHSEHLARRYHFNLPFETPGKNPIRMDLHWELTDRFAGYTWDTDGLWERAVAARFSGRPAWVLSLEDLLTYLAVHADGHGYLNRALAARQGLAHVLIHPYSENRLIWFVDLSELLHRFGDHICWNDLVSRARRAGVSAALSSTFRLLNELFSPQVPRAILDELGAVRPPLAKRVLLSQLLGQIDGGQPSAHPARRWQALLVFRHGVQFRLIRLLDLCGYIFPSFDQVARRHRLANRRWAMLYYPVHIVRALVSCIGLAGALLFHLAVRPFRIRARES